VRDGYNQALREKKRHIGFLMILMQRLVASSTRAILSTLKRREAVLKDNELRERQLSLSLDAPGNVGDFDSEEIVDMEGQELLDELVSRVSALRNERVHVEMLLKDASACEEAGPDAKAEALIKWGLQQFLSLEATTPCCSARCRASKCTEPLPTLLCWPCKSPYL